MSGLSLLGRFALRMSLKKAGGKVSKWLTDNPDAQLIIAAALGAGAAALTGGSAAVAVLTTMVFSPSTLHAPEALPGEIKACVEKQLEGEDEAKLAEGVGSSLYEIKYGDTLTAIARANGVRVEDLCAWNPFIKNPDKIYAGDVIVVSKWW